MRWPRSVEASGCAVALGLLLATAACVHAPAPAAPSGRLSIEVVPPQASVLIDDRLLPRQSDGGLRAALTVGPHRVEVYAPGYFHAYRDIELPLTSELQLKIALRADPDAQVDSAPPRLPVPPSPTQGSL